jgi:hypothetical protein
MIMEPTGSIPKVTGNKREMVATGPIPGSTPIRVPINTPRKQKKRLVRLKATLKPRVKLFKISIY